MINSTTKNFFIFSVITIGLFCGHVATSLAQAPEQDAKPAATKAAETSPAKPAAIPLRAAGMVEDQHYITKFPNSDRAKGPVVVEFFSYMCPHCYRMENTVKRWMKQKPADVEFVKIPATFSSSAYQLAARAHYIAEELGVLDTFAPAMYKKIHVDRRPPRNDRDLARLFAELGVSDADYKKASVNNFNVESKLRRASFLLQQYQVTGVPYFLVNYKYELGPEANKSQDALFNIWNNLPYKDFN
jgi:thiol:disulfide interchange protein DsbA